MGWVVCIENLEEKKFQCVDREMLDTFDPDDPRYGADVHVVPVKKDAGDLSFGVHEFTRECACHPAVQPNDGRTLVIHSEKVN